MPACVCPICEWYTPAHTHTQDLAAVSPFSSWVAVDGLETKTGFYISDSLFSQSQGVPSNIV